MSRVSSPKEIQAYLKKINKNKFGSVRYLNGKLYIDFYYEISPKYKERIRETVGWRWSKEDAYGLREELDEISRQISLGQFRFADMFPNSKKKKHITNLEMASQRFKPSPSDVKCGEYAETWFQKNNEYARKKIGVRTERTMYTYRVYWNAYIKNFWQDKTFSEINTDMLNQFSLYVKSLPTKRTRESKQRYFRHRTINYCMCLLANLFKDAAHEYQWNQSFQPFQGRKKLPLENSREKVNPITLDEQRRLIEKVSDHWEPYIRFAFCTGLRQSEINGIKPEDINWEKNKITIRTPITFNLEGKKVDGEAKNRYSVRTLTIRPSMKEILLEQMKIQQRFQSTYFFCSINGNMIEPSVVRKYVWIPALEEAGVSYRNFHQTRHVRHFGNQPWV